MDNEIVPGNHGTTLKLKKVTREYNNKIVKCEVNNVIGKSEETETLDIHCKYSVPNKCKHVPTYLFFGKNSTLYAVIRHKSAKKRLHDYFNI